MQNRTLLATLTMVGTIIGAGIFGVPYVFAISGVPIGVLYLLVLGLTAIASHGLYAFVASCTPGKHRLMGYARIHLGRGAARLVGMVSTFELLGALLAYIILGGAFLSTLFPGTILFWTLVFFAVMALLIAMPFSRVESYEALLTWLLLGVGLVIVAFVIPSVKIAHLTTIHSSSWYVPYGVIFFSLGGASAVPEVVDSLKKNLRTSLIATTVGTVIAIVVTGLFGVVIAGATGGATSENAITGLVPIVGHQIIVVGAVFGLLAVATSFITIGSNLRDQFAFDLKLPPGFAWAVTVGTPLLAFMLGARSFISVIGFLGAVLGVIAGIVILLISRRVLAERRSAWARVLRATTIPIMVLFLFGIIAELLTLWA